MQLRQLIYFVRIVESGSLSRASQALHVAQPALSQQVNQLEVELGVKLLNRSVRGVSPTDAGTAVFRHAQRILKQVEATHLIATEADTGPAGTVTVGLPWTVASLLGLDLLRQVQNKLKAVRLEIVEGPSSLLAAMLAEGKVEIAVLFDHTVTSSLIMRRVLTEPLFFVGPPGTLSGKPMSLEETAAYPLLLMSRPNGIREMVESRYAALGVRPDVQAEINSPGLLLDAIKTGLGYSILPACGLELPTREHAIDAVLLSDPGLCRTVHLCTSRMFALTRAAEQVQAILREAMLLMVRQGQWHAELVDLGEDRARNA